MPRGGKRPGAGRPKGSKEAHTLQKDAAREALRAMVFANLKPMTEAQIAAASGIRYLVGRQKKGGKFVHLTEGMVKGILDGTNEDYEAIEVWEKLPSTNAFTDLMNRAIDKPTEQMNVDVTIAGLEERIRAAQARVDGK